MRKRAAQKAAHALVESGGDFRTWAAGVRTEFLDYSPYNPTRASNSGEN
jgi:hypothetical protein